MQIISTLALIGADAERLRDVARTRVHTAQHPEANTLSLRPRVPGRGQLLRLVRLDESQQLARCPRRQDGASYGRLVTWAKASAGQRCGTTLGGPGHAPLSTRRTTASRNADERLGPSPCARRLIRHHRRLLLRPREWSTVHVGCSSPEPEPTWSTWHVYPVG